MEFSISDVVYTKTSGSLSNVIDKVNYRFAVSGSDSDGIVRLATKDHSLDMPAAKSSGYVAYASCSQDVLKGWVKNQYISQSSGEGGITSSLWGTYTSSINTQIVSNLSQSIYPRQATGRPWE